MTHTQNTEVLKQIIEPLPPQTTKEKEENYLKT